MTTTHPVPPRAELDLRLASDVGWAMTAAALLADLGFLLVGSEQPGPRGSHLLIALRPEPTERHFDPEELRYFAPVAGRGQVEEMDRAAAAEPAARAFLWGHLHVVDRFGTENRFLSFGGTLRSAVIDDGLTVIDAWSPGPIVRWGGHSQGADRLAAEIGAFFGRLIVPVDFAPGAEARLDAASAATIYAAFLLHARRRLGRGRVSDPELERFARWLGAERRRLDDPAVWDDARALLNELGLAAAPPVAA